MAPPVIAPLRERVKKLVISLQFLWFVGHLFTTIQSLLCVYYGSVLNYQRAFYGTLLTYGIILFKAHGKPQFTKEFLAQVLQDENSQYFLLAIVWATANPISVVLFPYATFSLFHTLGYVRSDLIPKVFPHDTLPPSKAVASTINRFMLQYQPTSIWAVSRAEVWVILPMTIITIFHGGTSFFTPIMYQQFLQFRFLSSPLTRQAFGEVEGVFDWLIKRPQLPAWLKSGYEQIKAVIKKYCNLEQRARDQNKPAQAQ